MYTITWSTYFGGIILIMILYYLVAFLLFFSRTGLARKRGSTEQSRERTNINMGVKERKAASITEGMLAVAPSDQTALKQERMQAQVHDMVDELQAYIKEAAREGIEKDEVLQSLYSLAGKYPDIKGSLFQDGIRNLVAATVEDHCAYRLSADELALLWTGVQA